MSGPRVLFYVQHLLGIGHLARASRVANALVESGFAVTMVTGGMPVKFRNREGEREFAPPRMIVVGRIERTLFMLDWIENADLRMECHAGLNKGEARHALARAVFAHSQGRIHDRSDAAQQKRAMNQTGFTGDD